MAEEPVDDTYFAMYREGQTDGLPVIPPTEERVAEMLRGTDLDREHVIGRLGNQENPLTVEQLAANGVMAGCIPPYMPVLVAGARVMADPESNTIQFSVSTASWSYQWLVNGPVRDALDIASGSGAFGPSFHANQTIPRALGMTYRNVTKIYPGEKDMGVMGHPGKFYTLAGENEEASPWEPFHVTHGYDSEASTITLAGPNSWIQWLPSENTADHLLRGMIRNTPEGVRAQPRGSIPSTIFHAINPYNAEELEKADLSKREIKEYLVENSHYEADEYNRGMFSDEADVTPAQRRQYRDVAYINIVTVGGPGRVNAILGPTGGGPLTKRIEFPNNWGDLVEEYMHEVERNWVPVGDFYD